MSIRRLSWCLLALSIVMTVALVVTAAPTDDAASEAHPVADLRSAGALTFGADGTLFVADAKGNAKFVHSFKPGLEMSDVWTTSMLAINYHSDGKTYGGLPGDFGLNAHIPLFVMLPKRAGLD